MNRKWILVAVAFFFVSTSTVSAGVVTGTLDPAVVDTVNETATFDLHLIFEDPGDLYGFSVDVVNSTVLNSPVADYGLFTFEVATDFAVLSLISDFGESPSNVYTRDGQSSNDKVGVLDAEVKIGTLKFDYSSLNLSGGDFFTVDVTGLGADTPTTTAFFLPGGIGGIGDPVPEEFEIEFDLRDGGQRTVFLPGEATDVPEPASLAIMGLAGLIAMRSRRRRA